jgi:hypothetical protein
MNGRFSLRHGDDRALRLTRSMRVDASVWEEAGSECEARFETVEIRRPIVWAIAVAAAWGGFAAGLVALFIVVNARIGSLSPSARTALILSAISGGLAFVAGFVISLASQSSRRLRVRLSHHWVEIAGERELNATPFRDVLHLPRGDVRAERRDAGCVLHVDGLGDIHLGRSWTFASDPGPTFGRIAEELGTRPHPSRRAVSRRPARRSITARRTNLAICARFILATPCASGSSCPAALVVGGGRGERDGRVLAD